MDFEDWLRIGFDNGWVGAPVCETHDGVPMTASEDKEFEEGSETRVSTFFVSTQR